MTLTRFTLALTFLSATAAACSVETTPTRDGATAPERGLGKADGVFGSCGNEETNTCGNSSDDGNCWCDDLCADFGDCCADKTDVCGGEDNIDPTPKLCLGENSCDEGEVCDTTQCLSGCSGAAICPAVCFGVCVEGNDPEPWCGSLGEKECDDADGCAWTTSPGFPGPISTCVAEDEDTCKINPALIFCEPGTMFDLDECTCVGVEPPPPADCEPEDDSYVVVTGDEIVANSADLVGTRVWLTGEAQTTFPICTQLACSPENACCNSCGASITMDLGSAEVQMSGIGCGGNNCNVMANCEYGIGEGFSAWGTLEDTFGTLFLDIDGHCGT